MKKSHDSIKRSYNEKKPYWTVFGFKCMMIIRCREQDIGSM